jgi:hypothetical protein
MHIHELAFNVKIRRGGQTAYCLKHGKIAAADRLALLEFASTYRPPRATVTMQS